MEKKILKLQIITPEKIKYNGEINTVTVPGPLGILGILVDHVELISTLEAGEVNVKLLDNEELFLFISDGLIEVKSNNIIILTDTAESAEDVEIEKEKSLLSKLYTDFSSSTDILDKDRIRQEIRKTEKKIVFVSKFREKATV